MADNIPYIGYRSAGRRPESQQDRRASADAPLAALRGMVSGVLGAPGDIESLVRMLPGLSERTVLPTSEDVERRLPLRSASETPIGRVATGMGTLGGGFYTGPGSPLRAISALPSAVSRAGRDFAMAAGQPAVNVVKPKGGNWLSGSVEKALQPMRINELPDRQFEEMRNVVENPDLFSADKVQGTKYFLDMHNQNTALNKWLETKLGKYMRNEMGTPEDPLRALAERGVTHQQQSALNTYNIDELEKARELGGFPAQGLATTRAGREWEAAADYAILPDEAGVFTRPPYDKTDPWLFKVPPETKVYSADRRSGENMFGHLMDEMRNAIDPNSELPAALSWKYSDLDKVTVPQAVERVAKINEWRAAQKAEADAARAMNPATQVVKEYPEQGFKWVELRQPEMKEMPSGYSVKPMDKDGWFAVYGPDGRSTGAVGKSPDEAIANQEFGRQSLEDALKYEGETMGHCVGGYCPDVVEGRSKIYSLRDKKGQPHVTIEVAPRPLKTWDDVTAAVGKDEAAKLWKEFDDIGGNNMSDVGEGFDIFIKNKGIQPTQDIVQIKGKANRAPKEDYLPAVQDFVRSQQWGRIGDLQNTGLVQLPDKRLITKEQFDEGIQRLTGEGEPSVNAEWFQRQIKRDPSWWDNASGAFEGFAAGGLVANFHTGDFDPDRIDAIVGELHALNAG
jgi:hypothetical protein